ncbi:M16 family metallopeptidase [Planctomycetota bacterium]
MNTRLLPAVGLALLLLTALPVWGKEAPEPPVAWRTLENGIRLAIKPDHHSELVNVTIHVSGGARTETRELSGLSHYYEHLIFRGGTDDQAELETRKAFEALGIFFGYTDSDHTCYYVTVPKANLSEGLRRLVDVVMDLEVTPEKVETEREIILSEYKMRVSDSPSGQAFHELYRNAFRVHPYGQTVIGLREVIEEAGLDRFRTFYEERYVPSQLVIAAVGDLDVEDMVARLEQAFAPYERGAQSFELDRREPVQKAYREVVTVMPQVQHAYVALGWPAPAANDADWTAVALLSKLLTAGKASRLSRALKEERSLAIEVWSGVDHTRDPGLLTVFLRTEPQKAEEALTVLYQELVRLARDGVSREEVNRVAAKWAREHVLQHESCKDQADALGRGLIVGDRDYLHEIPRRIESVQPSDLTRALVTRLDPNHLTLSYAGPKKDFGAEEIARDFGRRLRQARPVTVPVEIGRGRLYVRTDRSAPIVAVDLALLGGLAAEREQAGLQYVWSRMLREGTSHRDGPELASALDQLGASFHIEPGRDAARVTLVAPSESFARAYDLALEALRAPAFAEDDLERIKAETARRIEGLADDSYEATYRAYYRTIYKEASPYSRTVHGRKETVQALTTADLRRFHLRRLHSENLVGAVVGDVALAGVSGPLREVFATTEPAPSVSPDSVKADYSPSNEEPPFRLVPKDREQITFQLGVVTSAAAGADYLPLAVAARAMGSHNFFKYIYERGVAYRCWTYQTAEVGPGHLTVEMGVSAPSFKASLSQLLEDFAGFRERGLSEQEFELAKANLLQRAALARATNSGIAAYIVRNAVSGLGYDRYERLPALLAELDRDTVNAAIKKHIDPKRFRMAAVGPETSIRPVLEEVWGKGE